MTQREINCPEYEKDQSLLVEMMDWCFENDIEYITELIDYAAKFRDDWCQLLSCSHGYVPMTEFLRNSSER